MEEKLLPFQRNTGPNISPFNAWILSQGMETLSVRMREHLSNAQRIAEWLHQHPQVEQVQYCGLPTSEWYPNQQKYAPKGGGAVMSFEIKGGREAGMKFVEGLKMFRHVANIGDVRSLVIHPASTTHRQLEEDQQIRAGAAPDMVRVSIGIETVEDIIADLDQGLAKASA